MGKEWLGGGGGGGNKWSAAKRKKIVRREMKESSASAGYNCMSAVFDLFHSTRRNYHNTPPNYYPFLQEKATTTTTTGVEAPRNSLELETAAIDEASIPQAMKQELQNLNFPAVGNKIKTGDGRILSPRISTSNSRFDDNISSNCSSPKTPSVVARLMGLDLLPLPESTSPSPSIMNSNKSRKDSNLLQFKGPSLDDQLFARSLPETPRTSSSSRKSDVERHRLSLQIDKDKFSLSDDINIILACRRGKSDIKRIVGQDITNTNTNTNININNKNGQSTTHQNLSLRKNKRNNSKTLSKYRDENIRQCKIEPTTTTTTSPRSISPSYDISHQEQKQKDSKKVGKKLMSRRDDGFVRRSSSSSSSRERNKEEIKSKIKRRPLSCPTQLLKNGPSSTTHTKSPQEKSQVSDSLSPKSNTLTLLSSKATVSPCTTTGGGGALHGGCSPEQRNYIQIILKYTNMTNPLAKWHTPSQPIDPKLFHQLEFLFKAAAADGCRTFLRRRCERKLIFQLVDELLAEILTQHFQSKRRGPHVDDGGCFTAVVEALCKKIDSFPAAKCVVLEDIDSLIERDLCKSEFSGFKGEDEGMVSEIEDDIMEWLVCEAVAVMGGDAAEEQIIRICHVGL